VLKSPVSILIYHFGFVSAILSKVSKFDLYTDQLVVAMETGDKNSGIIGSLDWLSLETNFEHSKTGLYIFLNFW
jgi:hypothetical protein